MSRSKTKILGVRVLKEEYDKLRRISKDSGLTITAVIRTAIKAMEGINVVGHYSTLTIAFKQSDSQATKDGEDENIS